MESKKQKREANIFDWFSFSPIQIQKFLDLMVKVFTGMITVPATYALAYTHFSYVPDAYRYVIASAAVGLVEGVFFASLWLLEARKDLSDSEKVTNTLVVWAMFGLMLWIALQVESATGVQGWIFRGTLLIYLARNTQASVAYMLRRREARTEQRNSWLVELALSGTRRTAAIVVGKEMIKSQRDAALKAINERKEEIENVAFDSIGPAVASLGFSLGFASASEKAEQKPKAKAEAKSEKSRAKAEQSRSEAKANGSSHYNIEPFGDGFRGQCPYCNDYFQGPNKGTVIAKINGHAKAHRNESTPEVPVLPQGTPIGEEDTFA